MAVRKSKSRSTNRDDCDGESEELYRRVIRRKLDLGRTGFARRRHRKRRRRLERQVLAGTRHRLARRVPPILSNWSDTIDNSKDLLGVLIEAGDHHESPPRSLVSAGKI